MTKKELKKLMEPVDPKEAQVQISYTVSEDKKKVTLEFDSQVPMDAWDLICLLCDFINDFIANALKEDGQH